MAVGIVGDAALGHQEDAGQFRPEFFFGIGQIAEAIGFVEGLPVEPCRVPAGVGRLMEGGSVVGPGRLEC